MEGRLLAALALLSGDATTSERRDGRGVPARAPEAPGYALANGPGPGDDDDDDDANPGGGGGGNIDPDDDEGYDDDDGDDDEETLQVCRPRGRVPYMSLSDLPPSHAKGKPDRLPGRESSSRCTIPW